MKKINLDFPDISQDLIEKRKIKEFKAMEASENNKDIGIAWALAILGGGITGILFCTLFGVAIDSLPVWFWTLTVLLSVSGIIGWYIIRSANRSRKHGIK